IRAVNERSPIELEKHPSANGYVASKWVAEKLFMTATDRGIPCNIFRLGLVWGDTKMGRYDERQREHMIITSCLLSGLGIRHYQFSMAPIPVDYVARAVVSLANRYPTGRGIFHVSDSKHLISNVFERCNELMGTFLHLLPFPDWIREIRRLQHEGR